MSPFGHACAGLVLRLGARTWPWWAAVAGALAPDLDFLMFAADGFNEIRRGPTHSLAFALGLAGLAALVARRWSTHSPRAVGLAVLFGVLSHLAIDACFDANPSNGLGVAWLWPYTDQRFLLHNLSTVDPEAGWGNPRTAARGVLQALPYELGLGLVVGALTWLRRERADDRGERNSGPDREQG